MSSFESDPSDKEEQAENRELLRQIFNQRERVEVIGRTIPSDDLIASYFKELDEIRGARLAAEHPDDDTLLAA